MKKRIIGAAILLSLFIPLVIIGEIYFALFILVLGLIGFFELYSLKYKGKRLPLLLEILSVLSISYLILNNFSGNTFEIILDYKVLSLFLIVYLIPIVIIRDIKKYNLEDALYLLGATIFIGLSFNLLILLRNFSLEYLLYLFIVTTMTDSFAFFTGKLVGRNKLCPKISPNKTIEGVIGGTIMGTFIATVFYLTVINPDINIIYLVGITFVLSVVCQVGDLVFSAIKRYFNIKDYSKLIPGHGGILDRFDSIIFVVIVAILFIGII